MLVRTRLQIVATEHVLPHEIADPGRQQRIEDRLRVDGMLRDPLMVGLVPDLDDYVLLDGTNRKGALAGLGYPRVMVQIVDYADQHAVQLHTWCHATHLPMRDLLEVVSSLPGIIPTSLPPLAAQDALTASDTLAVLLDRRERYALTMMPEHKVSRTEQLCRLVDVYEQRMDRVGCDPEEVEEHAQKTSAATGDAGVLIAFPRFSRSQVVAMALEGALIPAGITRHIILCGRALRVNLPLELLGDAATLDAANEAFERHLSGLQPRTYQEPTILFDS